MCIYKKRKLIIVGNGFDLYHDLKTQYIQYRQYLLSHGYGGVVHSFEIGNDELESDIDFLWKDIESIIGLLNYESAYHLLTSTDSEDWTDASNHDFEHEVSRMTDYWPILKDKMKEWINSIEYTNHKNNLLTFINDDSYYISFNYTSTLEILYGICPDNILYIHGNSQRDNELILGHNHKSYYPEWDDSSEETDIRLRRAGEIMERHRLNTIKPVDLIIEKNADFLNAVNNVEEIFVLGLSYADVDLKYLEYISNINKNMKWNFSWYTDDDKSNIDKVVSKLNIVDYKKIRIEEI